MYPNMQGNPYYKTTPVQPKNDYQPTNDRIVGGGFLGPFILGGITGGLVAPAFYPRPYYGPNYYGPVPRPYPYYGPYYR